MKLRSLVLLVSCACIAMAYAEQPVEQKQKELLASHKLILFGDGQAKPEEQQSLIQMFYEDQFMHAHDPRAPYFLFMSRNSQMAMGLGGQIQGIAQYDWHGSMDGSDFCPYNIDMQMDPANVNQFQTSIGYTSLFFTAFGRNQKFGNFQLYIQAKFVGGSFGARYFKLKKAYATVGDWTVGLASSTFSDPAAQPNTIETEGPNSEVSYSRILLRYMHFFKHNLRLALSVENPDFQIAPSTAYYESGKQHMPNIAAFFQYGTAHEHVRLSGIYKNMRYRNLVEAKNAYVSGWGVQLSTVFNPVSPLVVYAAGQTGQGIGNLINDLSQGDNDLLGRDNKSGTMYAPRSFGWYVGLEYHYSPKVCSSLIFSQERLLPKSDSVYGEDMYKYGLYGTANVFWNITARCKVGAELNIGRKVVMSGDHRMAYRANLLAQFDF